MESLAELAEQLRAFAAARNWEQFHTPKNLTMALAGEVGELVAELQWLGDAEIAEGLRGGADLRAPFENEMADVFIYLVRLADLTGVDLLAAAEAKIERNQVRYPVATSWGSAAKHDQLGQSSA